MRILLLIDGLDIGGAETHVVTLARGLQRAGHRVMVVSEGGVLEEQCRNDGVQTLRFPRAVRSPSFALSAPALVTFLHRLQTRYRFDVLHAHTRRCAWLLWLFRRTYRAALPSRLLLPACIVTAHARFRPRGRRLSYWGEATIAVSEDLKVHLHRAFGVDPRRVSVIPNGIDTDEFCPPRKAGEKGVFRVVFASRLDKDCSAAALALLDAFDTLHARAADRGLALRLTVLGGGECLDEVRERAEQLQKRYGADAVRVVGATDRPAAYFQRADVFVGVSRAALEAAACGCSVILAGNEGFGGLLTPERLAAAARENFCCRSGPPVSPEALVRELVTRMDTSPGTSEASCAAVRAYVLENLCLAQSVAKTQEVYRRVLTERRRLRVLIVGYAGCGNLGDDAILRRFCQCWQGKDASASPALPEKGAACDIDPPLRLSLTALTGGGKQDECRFGMPCVDRRRPTAVLRALNHADILVLGGGALLQNGSARGNRSLAYYLTLPALMRLRGRPYEMVANGLGPLHGRLARALVARTAKRAQGVSVRDEEAKRLLVSLGLSPERVRVERDPVRELKAPALSDAWQTARRLLPPDVRPDKVLYVLPRASQEGVLSALGEALTLLVRERKTFPVFVPMDTRQDVVVCRALCRAVGQGLVLSVKDEGEAVALFAPACGVLSMRLHGLILAAAGGAPALGLSYDDRDTKLAVFAREEGLPALGAGATADDILVALRSLIQAPPRE